MKKIKTKRMNLKDPDVKELMGDAISGWDTQSGVWWEHGMSKRAYADRVEKMGSRTRTCASSSTAPLLAQPSAYRRI